MLELAILGLLKERSMHGYQLKKQLSDTLGVFWQVSYGSLYPALKRLQREGCVEMAFPREEVGRRKNVYRVTEAGEKLFAELLEASGQERDEENGFRVRMAFGFRYLKPEARIGVLQRRKAYLVKRVEELKQRLASYRDRLDTYSLSLMRHGMDSTEHDIRWLDDMIRAEREAARKSKRPTRRRRTVSKEGARS